MNLSFSKFTIVLLAFAMCLCACESDKTAPISTSSMAKEASNSMAGAADAMKGKAETVSNKSDELLEIYVSPDENSKSDENARVEAERSVEKKLNEARSESTRTAETSTPRAEPVSSPAVVNSTPKVKEPIADEEPPLKPTKISFDKSVHEYGMIMQGDKVSHKFNFTNTGSADLVISDVSASCGCTKPSYPFIPIAPGERGYIGVNFDSKGKLGRQQPTVTVVSNAGTTKLKLEGFVDAERAKQPSPDAPKVEIIDDSEMEKLKEEALKSAPKAEEGGQK